MTQPPSDLARLLGYLGAVPDGAHAATPVEVATDIYRLPFWSAEFCALVIDACEVVGFAPDPADPVPAHEVSLATVSPVLFGAVEHDIGVRVWPQLRSVWPLIEYRGLRDAFVVRYREGEQRSLRLHNDIAQVSAIVRLNDGYDGAALRFPRQGYDSAGLAVGDLIAWPSLVTHPHEATPITSGVRYGLTIWCELPDDIERM